VLMVMCIGKSNFVGFFFCHFFLISFDYLFETITFAGGQGLLSLNFLFV
jgi:hypothetical protein